MTADQQPIVPRPTPWAQGVLAAAHGLDVPDYGSPAWEALPYDSPARIAAVVLAAEVHRYEVATLADRLRIEIDERARQDQEEAELALTWTPTLTRKQRESAARRRPTMAELSERRGEPERAERARAQERRIAALPSITEMIRRVS